MSSVMPVQRSHLSKRIFLLLLFAAAFVISLLTAFKACAESFRGIYAKHTE